MIHSGSNRTASFARFRHFFKEGALRGITVGHMHKSQEGGGCTIRLNKISNAEQKVHYVSQCFSCVNRGSSSPAILDAGVAASVFVHMVHGLFPGLQLGLNPWGNDPSFVMLRCCYAVTTLLCCSSLNAPLLFEVLVVDLNLSGCWRGALQQDIVPGSRSVCRMSVGRLSDPCHHLIDTAGACDMLVISAAGHASLWDGVDL